MYKIKLKNKQNHECVGSSQKNSCFVLFVFCLDWISVNFYNISDDSMTPKRGISIFNSTSFFLVRAMNTYMEYKLQAYEPQFNRARIQPCACQYIEHEHVPQT